MAKTKVMADINVPPGKVARVFIGENGEAVVELVPFGKNIVDSCAAVITREEVLVPGANTVLEVIVRPYYDG